MNDIERDCNGLLVATKRLLALVEKRDWVFAEQASRDVSYLARAIEGQLKSKVNYKLRLKSSKYASNGKA